MKRLFLILIISLVLNSCQDKLSGSAENPLLESNELERTFHRGGSPVEVIVRLSAEEIMITEFLTVTIEVWHPEGTHITPPYLSEQHYDPLKLVESPKKETGWSEEKSKLFNRWAFRLEPLISGDFSIKPFVVGFRFEKEKTKDPKNWPVYKIHSEAIPYKVNSAGFENLDDIKGIKGKIIPPYDFFPLIIAGLATISVFCIYFLSIRLTGRKRLREEPVERVDYRAIALSKLLELEKKKLEDQAAFDRFHTELADLLRDYIENIFGLKAKEQTTEEFIKGVYDTNQFTPDQRGILNRYLQLADLVKFATYNPGSEISFDALKNVREFVQSTEVHHEI